MKKCPICDRTFDDAMKFCQTDGTPLVAAAEAEPLDPFKTMVGGSFGKAGADDILQIPPESDPLKTSYATDEEMRKEMSSQKPVNDGVIDVAPLAGDASYAPKDQSKMASDPIAPPSLPQFDEPQLSPPSFGERQTPNSTDFSQVSPSPATPNSYSEPTTPKTPAPFDDKTEIFDTKSPFDNARYNPPNAAIPSPFGESRPSSFDAPSTPLPTYKDSEPFSDAGQNNAFNQAAYNNPFEQNQPLQAAQWTPPPAPEANWQNQPVGANTPFQPPAAGSGQNNTLSIVSLVLGILSIPCCGFVVFGIGAAVTGFLAKKKADENPALYGGRRMALAGMIIGIITAVLGLVLTVLQVLFGAFNNWGNM